ncbi:hypothetical protein PR003_g13644 [Phytophthora rubi]|uniref:Uncharacterized protein n=1 Tax=Phytophthora rubi TaxID=129364 RepID=A0A6A4FGQ7_9STRA|nr:hypothetical protein PR003_g13644 [Phytophthora rubi]
MKFAATVAMAKVVVSTQPMPAALSPSKVHPHPTLSGNDSLARRSLAHNFIFNAFRALLCEVRIHSCLRWII